MDVSREQVLAYRAAAQGLDRSSTKLAVLDLGVQDTPAGSARLALAARTTAKDPAAKLTLVWSFRGAPHFHRVTDLAQVAGAVWPLSDADAQARVPALKGIAALDALNTTTKAVHAVTTKPLTKGELSAAVTERIPEKLSAWCRGCGSTHVFDSLLRAAVLPAGVRIEPGSAPLVFVRITGWKQRKPDPAAATATARAYLKNLGPAGPAEVAGFLGTKRTQLTDVWPEDLAEVRVDGRKVWLPAAQKALLEDPPPADYTRLLPPSDPFLQARDRELLVPDKKHRAELWRILGNPGAVLANGEVAGTWRAKLAGKRLDVTVTPFRSLDRKRVEEEAARTAEIRGATDLHVRYDKG